MAARPSSPTCRRSRLHTYPHPLHARLSSPRPHHIGSPTGGVLSARCGLGSRGSEAPRRCRPRRTGCEWTAKSGSYRSRCGIMGRAAMIQVRGGAADRRSNSNSLRCSTPRRPKFHHTATASRRDGGHRRWSRARLLVVAHGPDQRGLTLRVGPRSRRRTLALARLSVIPGRSMLEEDEHLSATDRWTTTVPHDQARHEVRDLEIR